MNVPFHTARSFGALATAYFLVGVAGALILLVTAAAMSFFPAEANSDGFTTAALVVVGPLVGAGLALFWREYLGPLITRLRQGDAVKPVVAPLFGLAAFSGLPRKLLEDELQRLKLSGSDLPVWVVQARDLKAASSDAWFSSEPNLESVAREHEIRARIGTLILMYRKRSLREKDLANFGAPFGAGNVGTEELEALLESLRKDTVNREGARGKTDLAGSTADHGNHPMFEKK